MGIKLKVINKMTLNKPKRRELERRNLRILSQKLNNKYRNRSLLMKSKTRLRLKNKFKRTMDLILRQLVVQK